MQTLVLVTLILFINWFFSLMLGFFPLDFLNYLAEFFKLSILIIFLSFLIWCFGD